MLRTAVFSLFSKTTLGLSLLIVSHQVYAHAQLLVEGTTPPRYDTASLKNTAPCGNEANFSNVKTNRVSVFLSGETINVQWKETIQHSGLFYLDFSTTGINGTYNNVQILPDTGSNAAWNMDYTLPAEVCTNCVLRMRQDMGNTSITGHYFSCADVILVSGDDQTGPAAISTINASADGTTVNLDWTNPADVDFKSTLIIRSNANLSDAPQLRKDYLVGDSIGNGVVVYKGNGELFSDTGLQAMSNYTYTFYSHDNDYNYNTGAVTTAMTGQDSGSGTGTVTPPDTNGDGGSGAMFWGVLPLLLVRVLRYRSL